MRKSTYKETASQKDKDAFAKYLSEDEELVIATGYAKNYMRHLFATYFLVLGSIFILAGLGIAYFYQLNLGYGIIGGALAGVILAFIKCIWIYHSHRYLLTTRRVMIKSGFFAVKLSSALYDKITHIEVEQGLWDRLVMGHGDIIVNTAGAARDELVLVNVESPIEFKNILERLINREREHYRRESTDRVVEGELVEQ